MFDIGFWEILVILVVALLVVGPDRLPGLAREVGMWVRKVQRFVTSVRSDIEQEFQTEELRKLIKEQNHEIDQLKNLMKDTEDSLRSEVEETSYLVKSIENELKDDPGLSSPDNPEGEAGKQVAQRTGVSGDRKAGKDRDPPAEDAMPRKDRDEPQT